jgi:drug/metabolite transporter (DMT)-like permease
LYFVGLKSTTPTVGCALSNTLPAITFVMAAVLKMETVRLATPSGQAKVFGTAVCVGGSMIMPFYKGPLLKVWASPMHWRYAEHTTDAAAPASGHAAIVGDVLIILSCVAWAVWFILQVPTPTSSSYRACSSKSRNILFNLQSKMSERFSAPYTSTTIMSLMAGVQCAGVSAVMDRSLSAWKLGLDIRLYAALYLVSNFGRPTLATELAIACPNQRRHFLTKNWRARMLQGIVGSGMAFAAMSWCIQTRGPLFVSMFSPLMLVVVAIVGWAILEEKIYVGRY